MTNGSRAPGSELETRSLFRVKEDQKETQDELLGGSSPTGSDEILHQEVGGSEDTKQNTIYGVFPE